MEYFSMNDLESSAIDDLKKVHDKINTKVSDYSCKCPPGGGSSKNRKNRKPIHIDKHHGEDDPIIPDSSTREINNVIINNVKFNECQTKNTDHCISDIYTYDDFGLPVSQNTAPTSDKNLLYTKDNEYVPNLSSTPSKCSSSINGCCADNRTASGPNGSNCNGFDYKSGLTGSPVHKLNNNALGGTKRMFIDESSGNSYMNYINSNLPKPTTVETFTSSDIATCRSNICTITKYIMLVCIILIFILIICVYSRRSRVSRIK